jgi:hypothetical protein
MCDVQLVTEEQPMELGLPSPPLVVEQLEEEEVTEELEANIDLVPGPAAQADERKSQQGEDDTRQAEDNEESHPEATCDARRESRPGSDEEEQSSNETPDPIDLLEPASANEAEPTPQPLQNNETIKETPENVTAAQHSQAGPSPPTGLDHASHNSKEALSPPPKPPGVFEGVRLSIDLERPGRKDLMKRVRVG